MEFVVAGLVLVSVVAIVNLVFTFGLVARVRELQEAQGPIGRAPLAVGVEEGDPLPDFAGVTSDGRPVGRGDVAGAPVLFGFFSPDCSSCVDAVPPFLDRARALAAAGGRSVAVVVGEDAHVSGVAAALGDAGTLIAEEHELPVSTAFRVEAFPVFVLADAEGTVTAAGVGIGTLPRAGAIA